MVSKLTKQLDINYKYPNHIYMVCICMYVYIWFVCIYMYVYICMYICVCVRVCSKLLWKLLVCVGGGCQHNMKIANHAM